MLVPVHRHRHRVRAAHVPHPAPSVQRRIAVQQLPPPPCRGDADLVVQPRHGREVEHPDDHIRGRPPPPEQRHDAVVRVRDVDPQEPARVEIHLVQGLLLAQDPVQVPDPQPQAPMRGVIQQVPVERRLHVPLPPLPELAAHE